jgi:hypothetical protein
MIILESPIVLGCNSTRIVPDCEFSHKILIAAPVAKLLLVIAIVFSAHLTINFVAESVDRILMLHT